MKKLISILMTLALATILVACSQQSQSQSSTTELSSKPKIAGFSYHGDIPKNPKKVVNFAYSYTGYLLELGVNVNSYSLDLEKNSPVFGDDLKKAKAVQLTSDDTEAIAAQEPDLIIAFSTDQNVESLKKIAPTLVITYGERNYLQMLTDLGKVFGKEDKAKAWLSQWQTSVDNAKSELANYISPDTTFTVMDFYDKDLYLYGKNWGRGGELVYDALGYKAPQKVEEDVFKQGWLGISQEVIGDYIGDYALLNVDSSTSQAAASLKESDVWKNIPAVQADHVLDVTEGVFYFSDPLSLERQLKEFVAAIKNSSN
ncbi:ABC transporter substrate-binding protein [Streptococcus sp. zg-JUN1979]|uniref:ABC transporter substrate-binding protein n=1 Tax=Streptococcus sp. zg-JUN1979 TaxID=3391450 RepID=UPI0039A5A232